MEPLYIDDDGNEITPQALTGELLIAPQNRARPTVPEGADPVEVARAAIDIVELTLRVQRNALRVLEDNEPLMTNMELQAAKLLIDKRMPAAPQQVDVNARVDVVVRRELLDDIVALLSAPGADTSVLARAMPTLKRRPAADEALARADGMGPEGWEPDTR